MSTPASIQAIQEIVFLHISDLHAQNKNKREIELRVKALFKDLEKNFPKIDIVIFTGDLAFAGKKEEYELAHSVLLEPLVKKFRIPQSSVLIIPGNHDVDREKIDWIEEEGLNSILNGDSKAYDYFTQQKYSTLRLSEYFDFVKSLSKEKVSPYYTSQVEVKNLRLGFACLNSAWRCSGDADRQKLFLTEEQVIDAAEKLKDAPIKIGLVHHPEDWFHAKNATALGDLNRQFEIILSGHKHKNDSVSEETPSHIVDNIRGDEGVEFEAVFQAAAKNKWDLTASTSNELFLELLSRDNKYENFVYFEIGYWGPSRIREFVTKYFGKASVDINAAYNFVTNSLKESDLPASPTILAMYLSIFPTLGNEVSSLSFLRLLEKIEQTRLDAVENSAEQSLYNKRAILMQIAKRCFELKVFEIPIADCLALIANFFESKLLTVNTSNFLESLARSGILSVDKVVRFSYYDFYDYYLALAFKEKVLDVNQCLTSIESCVSVSRALSLYGGLFRENAEIVKSVFGFVAATFKNKSEFTLKDLERYITNLLEPINKKETSDGAAAKTMGKKVDYEKIDVEYEASKQKLQEERRAQLLLKPAVTRADELGMSIEALKTFYNLFRNLENLDGKQKVQFLDAILDFHIQLNLDLIDFIHGLSKDQNRDFQTVTAYLITISGQLFLSTNIGNQSLHKAIDSTIKCCKNDLKLLLLISLYSELRLPGYAKRLKDFVEESNSLAAVEITFIQIKCLMVQHDKAEIPATLISAFYAAFTKRQQIYGDGSAQGSFVGYSEALNQTKKQHLAMFHSRDGAARLTSACD